MAREGVFIKEPKKKIEKIKKKYKNPEMSDETAQKIASLQVTNKLLKTATAAVGLVTVIDILIPDPLLGLDEAALTAITGLIGYSSSLVDNKIEALANEQDATIQMEEVTKLTGQLKKVASSVKKETPVKNNT